MQPLTLPRPSGFSLQAVADFYAGFVPGSGMASASADRLTLTFRLDGTFDAVAVALREEGDWLLTDVEGSGDLGIVARQLSRMLGLDADGAAWRRLGDRDPVVGKLQAAFAGFFTAAKSSPYDAATWAVIAPRMGILAAAQRKIALSEQLGDRVTLHGRAYPVFPAPRALEKLTSFPGLSDEKVVRLRGIAAAAREGRLDAARLAALGETRALADLMTLRGVGPWAASHIYFRGVAPEDALPTAEPRVLAGTALAYGIPTPSVSTF
jgi:DNA-3-methyladenine glycosylase II